MIECIFFLGIIFCLFIFLDKKAKQFIDKEVKKALRGIPLENELMFTKERKERQFNQ